MVQASSSCGHSRQHSISSQLSGKIEKTFHENLFYVFLVPFLLCVKWSVKYFIDLSLLILSYNIYFIFSWKGKNINHNFAGDASESGDTEEDLWTTWSKIINEWDSIGKKKLPHVKELSRKGIPHHFRGMAWQVLSFETGLIHNSDWLLIAIVLLGSLWCSQQSGKCTLPTTFPVLLKLLLCAFILGKNTIQRLYESTKCLWEGEKTIHRILKLWKTIFPNNHFITPLQTRDFIFY